MFGKWHCQAKVFNVAFVMGILSSSVRMILAEELDHPVAIQFPEACVLSCFGVTRWLALLHITKCCTFWCYTLVVLHILLLHIGSVTHFGVTLSAVLHGCLAGGGGGGVCGRHDHHSGQGAGSGRQRRWTFVILCCGQPAAILIYWTPATTLSRLYSGHIQNQKANWLGIGDFGFLEALISWRHSRELAQRSKICQDCWNL